MTSKFNWDNYEEVESPKSGFDWDSYEAVKPARGKLEKAARVGAQLGLSAIDALSLPLTIAGYVAGQQTGNKGKSREKFTKEIQKLEEKKKNEPLTSREERALRGSKKVLIQLGEPQEGENEKLDLTPSGIIKMGVKKVTGYDLEPEGFAEHAAGFIGAFKPKQLLEGAQKLKNVSKGFFTKTTQRLPSGLSKPKAVDSKIAPLTTIGPETQERAIEKLNKEAGKLAEAKTHAALPITKQIQQGVNYKGLFDAEFEKLDRAVAGRKITADLTPVTDLITDTVKKYRGIPKLHKDAVKIKGEIAAIGKRTPDTIEKLYKTYRSNNRKLSEIIETSRLKGSQSEYVKFLEDMNHSISESFEKTLGKDNSWYKSFKRVNTGYAEWKKGEKALSQMDKFFGGKLTPGSLEKLGNDPRTIKKLEMTLGKQGTKEISELAKDLKLAQDSIKRIPTHKLNKYELAMPLSYLVPVVGKFTGTAGAIQIGRNLLGSVLSRPETKRHYMDALKALANNDLELYKRAAVALVKSMNASGDEED